MRTVQHVKPDAVSGGNEQESGSSRVFFKIASVSTALGFGAAAASTASLRSSPVGFSFQLSAATFVAFAVGAAVGLIYWRLVASNSKAARRASFLIALGGVGLFLYPLRFVPAGNLNDLIIGLILAACALSVVGFLLWRVKRFLDTDSEHAGDATEPSSSAGKSDETIDS